METEAVTAATSVFASTNFIVALTMVIGGMMPAFAIAWISGKAMDAIGRNPEAGAKVQTAMVLSVAFAEAIAIYSLVTALIIKFVA